jgi:ribosomal protein S18 acetylase RimI-like enzyme
MNEKPISVAIRKLTLTDAPHYRDFRLTTLRRYPFAVGSNYADESVKPLSFYEGRIAAKESPDDFILGAFDGPDTLIGTAGLTRFTRRSERHKATLYGMAVHEDRAGRGIGKALVRELIAEARNVPGLLQIMLSVSEGNEPAERLYRSCGFDVYGKEPRADIKEGRAINKLLMVLMLD